jgi:hypothetical protein
MFEWESQGIIGIVDRSGLSGEERVELMQSRLRQISRLQAEFFADLVAVAEAEELAVGPVEGFEFAADEIRAALTWTRRAAETQLDLARLLVVEFPAVWEALREGRIDLPKARVIVEGLRSLNPELAAKVAVEILPYAVSHTTGQIAARLRRLVITVDPDAAAKSYRKGLADRRVELSANPDGTASLLAFSLPAERATTAMDHIDDLANQLRGGGEVRTFDQLRADVMLDLLCGEAVGSVGARRGVVDLRVDLATLAGLSERPAEIPGWGPVIADIARQVVETQPRATWQVTVTGNDGEPVWTGTTRRRPTTLMRRYVQARRPTCVFPGCRRPTRAADLDHVKAWAEGGITDPTNLVPLCRHDHQLKHRAGWKLETPQPGSYRWTSPLNQQYLVKTEPS